MADQVTFTVQRRSALGHDASKLRREGIVPGNIVGRDRTSIPVQFDGLEFKRLAAKHAASAVWQLSLGGGTRENVIVRHVQREPVTGAIQHVDFQHVEMNQPIKARVPLRLEGEAPGVRREGGMLLTLVDVIEVEARPRDLPEALTLDISGMEHLKDSLHVRDINAPNGVTVLTNADEPVVKIEPPRTMAEEVPAPAAEEAATPTGTAGEAGERAEAQS
jgi:large subunit ribosomal protein L25